MYNWSDDEKTLKKDPTRHAIWRLEQLINYGLGSEKLSEKSLRKYWHKLKIDPARKRFLSLLIYGRTDSQ